MSNNRLTNGKVVSSVNDDLIDAFLTEKGFTDAEPEAPQAAEPAPIEAKGATTEETKPETKESKKEEVTPESKNTETNTDKDLMELLKLNVTPDKPTDAKKDDVLLENAELKRKLRIHDEFSAINEQLGKLPKAEQAIVEGILPEIIKSKHYKALSNEMDTNDKAGLLITLARGLKLTEIQAASKESEEADSSKADFKSLVNGPKSNGTTKQSPNERIKELKRLTDAGDADARYELQEILLGGSKIDDILDKM